MAENLEPWTWECNWRLGCKHLSRLSKGTSGTEQPVGFKHLFNTFNYFGTSGTNPGLARFIFAGVQPQFSIRMEFKLIWARFQARAQFLCNRPWGIRACVNCCHGRGFLA
jgi:hypothetical protein